jgi:reductive dehalogenase
MAMIEFANISIGVLLTVAFCYAAVASFLDGEKRAGGMFVLLAVVSALLFFAVGFLDFPYQAEIGITLLSLCIFAALLFMVPTGCAHHWDRRMPLNRIDERDIMFSRRLLVPGTSLFEEYYARRPEKKAWDDKFRCRPGLLARGATQYDPIAFRAAAASFDTIEKHRPHVDGEPNTRHIQADPTQLSRFVKNWAKKLGAHSVGITRVQDYHMYSVVGRGADYGLPVALSHGYAIALTVEMDKRMLDSGPSGPTIMESAQKYVDSGTVALQIAEFIRRLGYSARAHIDGNYRVICPVVARDAGLGEIGRMGLLMTPDLGPRVRIAAVTTDMILDTDERTPDNSVLDFCERCRKCATCCPPWAIPFGEREEINGTSRWQINQELCYIYWTHIGTDCGRCVAVCPYSPPSRWMHDVVRWGVRRSEIVRRMAVVLDRLFYGKKPTPAPVPDWIAQAGKGTKNGFN